MSMTPLTKEADGAREREEATPSTARRAILQVPSSRLDRIDMYCCRQLFPSGLGY